MFKLTKRKKGKRFYLVGPVTTATIVADGTMTHIVDHLDGTKEVEIQHPDGREEKYTQLNSRATGRSLPKPKKLIPSNK